jgi:hypothetical protein
MTINRDLFLAILSMDSYNRGYGISVRGLGGVGSKLGKAVISPQSDIDQGSAALAAGFYALSYTNSGDTILITAKFSRQRALDDCHLFC